MTARGEARTAAKITAGMFVQKGMEFRVKSISTKAGARTVLAAGIMSMAGIAHAQTIPAPITQTPERRFDVSVTGDVLYDSNIARSDAVRAASRGLERSDVRMTPALAIDASLPVGPGSISIAASAGYDFHARNTQLNRERLSAAITSGLKFGACDLSLDAGYSRRQSDLADLGGAVVEIAGTVKNAEEIKEVGAFASCGGAIGIRPVGLIRYKTGDNSNIIRQGSDYRTFTYGAGLMYSQPSIGRIVLTAGQAETDFPNRGTGSVYPGSPGFTAKRVGINYNRNIGARLQATVDVNYVEADRQQATGNSFNGITWNVNVLATVSSRLQLQGEVGRAVQPSLGFNSDYAVEELYNLRATYALTSRLSLIVDGLHKARDYFGVVQGLGPVLLNDKTNRLTGSLSFNRDERMAIGLQAGYEKRNGNGTFYDYDGWRAGLNVKRRF